MKGQLAFVGDIHGNCIALQSLWSALSSINVGHTVFLGDYVNKGSQSADVIAFLGTLVADGLATLLRGNHESALLEGIETQNLTPFLKMGGAMTVRSYVGKPVGPDVWAEFAESIPVEHLELLRRMPEEYENGDVIARHAPWDTDQKKYAVSAHRFIGAVPSIGQNSAQLDTGGGELDGRLTALLWPSLDYLQVDAHGELVNRARHG